MFFKKKTVNRFGTNKCLVMSLTEKQSEPRYETYLPRRDNLCFPPHGGNVICSVKHALWPQPEHLHHHIPVPASIGITSHSSNRPLQEGMLGRGRGEKMKHLEDFWPVGVWTTSRDVFIGYLKSAALRLESPALGFHTMCWVMEVDRWGVRCVPARIYKAHKKCSGRTWSDNTGCKR